jgi:hypothetical protein
MATKVEQIFNPGLCFFYAMHMNFLGLELDSLNIQVSALATETILHELMESGAKKQYSVFKARRDVQVYRSWGSHSGGYEQFYLLEYNTM